jgi:hypothetical protein
VREQVEGLEDHPDPAAQRVDVRIRVADVLPLDQDRALGCLLEPVDAAQQGRLARSGRADDAHDLATTDVEVDPSQHMVVAEGLVQAMTSIAASARSAVLMRSS